MVQILKKYWYILVILILLFLIWYNFKDRYRFIERTKYEQSKVIENLRDSVNNLVEKNVQIQTEYDNQQKILIENINNTNEKIITKIVGIPRYSDGQRDSLWAVIETQEDSVPRRYWDILNQKTGGRSFKELTVQGPVQD
jgi:regulator of replication initiation timing